MLRAEGPSGEPSEGESPEKPAAWEPFVVLRAIPNCFGTDGFTEYTGVYQELWHFYSTFYGFLARLLLYTCEKFALWSAL